MVKLLIMESITVRPKSEKAIQLLHDLEQLDILEIISKGSEESRKSFSDKYRGIITPEQGADLHKHIEEMRNEWDRGI